MAWILNIDTAQEEAGLFLANKGKVIEAAFHTTPHDHASWVHEEIRRLTARAGLTLRDLQAIAVTAGPGSYTGLRIGMATAKGLCYALDIPLIRESTLKVMAAAMLHTDLTYDLICPMIDARRMEVFMAVYNRDLSEVYSPRALIVEYDFFVNLLQEQRIIFCGSGVAKWKKICDHDKAIFFAGRLNSGTLASLSYELFQQKTFTELSYAEPDYLKDFFTYSKTDRRRS